LTQIQDSICFHANLTLSVNNSNAGYWKIIQGQGFISDSTQMTTQYQIHPNDQILIFAWNEVGICSLLTTYDTVFVKTYVNFADAIAVPDTACDSLVNIFALNTTEPGIWSIISGNGVISNPNQAISTYLADSADIGQQIILSWTQTNDCQTISLIDSFTYIPRQNKPIIQQSGNQLIVTNYSTGQWFLNGLMLTDSISNILTPSESGIYSFGIKSYCDSIYSDTLTFVITEISEFAKNQIVIYPNPSNDEIFLKGIDSKAEVKLTDVYGKVLFSREIDKNTSLKKSELGISSGAYFIHIQSNTQKHSQKLIWY
jgi:hypothetical protein